MTLPPGGPAFAQGRKRIAIPEDPARQDGPEQVGLENLLFVGLWWFLWGMRSVEAERWSYFTLIYLLVGPALLYLPSILLMPEVPDAGELDLGSLFERAGRPIFLCLAGFAVWLACTEVYLLRQPFLVPLRAFQGVSVGVFLIGAVFPSRRMTAAVGAFTLVLVAVSWATVRAKLA